MREYGNTRSNNAQDQPADSIRRVFPDIEVPMRITLHEPHWDALSLHELVNLLGRQVEIVHSYRSVRRFVIDIGARAARRVVFCGTGQHRIGALHDGSFGTEIEPDFHEQLGAAQEQASPCKNVEECNKGDFVQGSMTPCASASNV